jgi:hypothetical protein
MRFRMVVMGLSAVASVMGATPVVAQTRYLMRERIVGMPKDQADTPPTKDQADTPPTKELGPVNIVVNGNGSTMTGWSGTVTAQSGYFRLKYGSTSVPLTQVTGDVAEAGYTYDVSFSCSNSQFTSNPVSFIWKVTSGGTVLGTGAYTNGARFPVKSIGTFVGTGEVVTFTLSNKYSQDILVDDVSITRRAQ